MSKDDKNKAPLKTTRELMTEDEAAHALGLDRVSKNPIARIRDLTRKGLLVKKKVGGFSMIRKESVEHYLES